MGTRPHFTSFLPFIILAAGMALSLSYLAHFLFQPLAFEDAPMHVALIDYQAKHFWPAASGWNDLFFPGFAQGTFYPPLPHWIAAALSIIASLPAEMVVKFLTAIAFLATPSTFLILARSLGLDWKRQCISLTVFFLTFFFFSQDYVHWSVFGQLVTGTFTQTVSYPLFFLYLSLWAKIESGKSKPKPDIARQGLLVAILLSHAILAFALLLWHAAYAIFNFYRGRRGLVLCQCIDVVLALAISSFFWLPFIAWLPFSFGYSFDGGVPASDIGAGTLVFMALFFAAPIWVWAATSAFAGSPAAGGKPIIWVAIIVWLAFIVANSILPIEEIRLFGYALLLSFFLLETPYEIFKWARSSLSNWDGYAPVFVFLIAFMAIASLPVWFTGALFPGFYPFYGLPGMPSWNVSDNIPVIPANNTFWAWEFNYSGANAAWGLASPVYFQYPAATVMNFASASSPMLFVQSSPSHAALDFALSSMSNYTFRGIMPHSENDTAPISRGIEMIRRSGANEISGSPNLLNPLFNCTPVRGSSPPYVRCAVPAASIGRISAQTSDINRYKKELYSWMLGKTDSELVWSDSGNICQSGWTATKTAYFPKWKAYDQSGNQLSTGMAFPYMLAVCGDGILKYETQPIEVIGLVISVLGIIATWYLHGQNNKKFF